MRVSSIVDASPETDVVIRLTAQLRVSDNPSSSANATGLRRASEVDIVPTSGRQDFDGEVTCRSLRFVSISPLLRAHCAHIFLPRSSVLAHVTTRDREGDVQLLKVGPQRQTGDREAFKAEVKRDSEA